MKEPKPPNFSTPGARTCWLSSADAFTAVSAIAGTPGLSPWGLCEPGSKVLGARWQELTLGNYQKIMEYPELNPRGSSSPTPTAFIQLLRLVPLLPTPTGCQSTFWWGQTPWKEPSNATVSAHVALLPTPPSPGPAGPTQRHWLSLSLCLLG